MYVTNSRCGRCTLCVLVLVGLALGPVQVPSASAQGIIEDRGIVQKITDTSDRLEMTVNTSQILTLGSRIPRIQVNNPGLLSVTALSATEIQVAAKAVGVTQLNLWDEDDNIYTVDVTILGDVRELELALRTQFPHSSIGVYKYTNSLVLKGFVDQADQISQIQEIAEDYAPKVVNNISVGGVHQIMLKVKVMEVSRTKLRRLGVDWASFSNGDFVISSVSGLISTFASAEQSVVGSGAATLNFGIVDESSAFFGLVQALEQNNLAKTLAEPVLTAVSGRPARFHVGGEVAYLVPQAGPAGVVFTAEFRPFGTEVDFLPIVLGNGNIRLEVRPKVSEIDRTLGEVTTGSSTAIPGFRMRQIDTGVEMKAGQTLALGGLVQQRVESQFRGIPIVSELPYLGAAFRTVDEEVNEIELLILVTPEFVDGMDPEQVPPCGPGMFTASPSDGELYMHGYLEVPKCPDGTCGPPAWPQSGPFEPGTVAQDGSMPMYEQVPSGINGSHEILPEGTPSMPPQPPAAPPENETSINRLPTAPVNLPSRGATPYRFDRNPTFTRGEAYLPADQPPGPIGATGYDVGE